MIHDQIINHLIDVLTDDLQTNIQSDDTARAGTISKGPLQGNPDPDTARISVTVHENDPDTIYGSSGTSSDKWYDEVYEIECGGVITWRRRFCVKARCLLVNTAEDVNATRLIASTLRRRIENSLLKIDWSSLLDDETGEYVSRGVMGDGIRGEMIQAGGPPDAYDYHIKVRFELLTTVGV